PQPQLRVLCDDVAIVSVLICFRPWKDDWLHRFYSAGRRIAFHFPLASPAPDGRGHVITVAGPVLGRVRRDFGYQNCHHGLLTEGVTVSGRTSSARPVVSRMTSSAARRPIQWWPAPLRPYGADMNASGKDSIAISAAGGRVPEGTPSATR